MEVTLTIGSRILVFRWRWIWLRSSLICCDLTGGSTFFTRLTKTFIFLTKSCISWNKMFILSSINSAYKNTWREHSDSAHQIQRFIDLSCMYAIQYVILTELLSWLSQFEMWETSYEVFVNKPGIQLGNTSSKVLNVRVIL
jgi:hypothetical protein